MRHFDAADGMPGRARQRRWCPTATARSGSGHRTALPGARATASCGSTSPNLRPGAYVWDLFEDRDGSLWVGTSSGLHRFREQQFTMFGTPEGFPSDQPTAVFEDRRARCGSASGTPVCWRSAAARADASLAPTACRATRSSASAARATAPCWSALAAVSRASTRAARRPSSPPDSLGRQTVYDVAEDGTGQDVARHEQRRRSASRALGSRRFSVAARRWPRPSSRSWSTTSGDVVGGAYDNGLWRYKDGVLEQFTQKDGLSCDAIRTLVLDGEGVLWIGTAGGGLSWRRDGAFGHLTAATAWTATTSVRSSPATRLPLARHVARACTHSPGGAILRPIPSVRRRDVRGQRRPALIAVRAGISDVERRTARQQGPHVGGDLQRAGDDRTGRHPSARAAGGAADSRDDRRRRAGGRSKAMELSSGVRRVEFQYSTVWLSTPERLRYNTSSKASTPTGSPPAPGVPRTTTTCRQATIASSSGQRSARAISGPATSLAFTRRASWFEAAWFPSAVHRRPGAAGLALYWLRLRQVRARFAVVLEERRGSRASCTTRSPRTSSASRLSSTAWPACCARRRRWPRSDSRWRAV